MRTEDLRTFVQIAESGSLTGASDALELPKSTVSRRLSRLEEELEAQLVLRTPRALQLTELGQLLHARATPVLAHLDDVERSLRERGETPAGPLRVSAPPDLATAHLGPLLGTFSLDHPRVELRLVSTNDFVDLIAAGFDVALRIHSKPLSPVSSMKARKLAKVERALYASPAYLTERGTPRRPQDLHRHALMSMVRQTKSWSLVRGREQSPTEVRFTPRITTDDHHSLTAAAESGAGIAPLPTFLGEVGVCRGRLVRVLPRWSLGISTLSAIWPASHHDSPRVRAFLDAVIDYFAPPPWTR